MSSVPPPEAPTPEELQAQLEAFQAGGDLAGEAQTRRQLAEAARAAGRPDEAQRQLQQAVKLFRETGDLRGLTGAMSELGGADTGAGARRATGIVALLVILAIIGGVAYGAIRVISTVIDATGGSESSDTFTDDTEPLPADRGPDAGRSLQVSPTGCDVKPEGPFHRATIEVRMVARRAFTSVVLEGEVTDESGRVLGTGVATIAPVRPKTYRPTIDVVIFDELPRGRVDCGVRVDVAFPE